MIEPFDPELLEKNYSPRTSQKVGRALGQVAGYWCNDSLWQLLTDSTTQRPGLPNTAGCCFLVLGVRNQNWRQYLLPGLLLPVQWSTNANAHDVRLPEAIHDCANKVLTAMEEHGHPYCLTFVEPEKPWPNLGRLNKQDIEADSCFVSLAAGLESLKQGTQQDPHVLASAVWNDEFVRVGCLEEKLSVALRWEVKTVFLSPDQDQPKQPESWPQKRPFPNFQRLGETLDADPRTGLAPLFATAMLEPDSTDSSACFRYHEKLRDYDTDRGIKYYKDIVSKHVTHACREQLYLTHSVTHSPTHMVTIATGFTQPIIVMAKTFDIKNLLVLYTKVTEKNADALMKSFAEEFDFAPCCRLISHKVGKPDMFSDCASTAVEHTSKFLAGVASNRVMFDIDRGLTIHKLTLIEQVIEPTNILATITYDYTRNRQVVHGSEQIYGWTPEDGMTSTFRSVTAKELLS